MILSKISLDLRSPSVRQALRNCQDMHRNVQSWFGQSRAEAGVLYRVYTDRRGVCLYMLSAQKPDLSNAKGAALLGNRSMDALESRFELGRLFRFDLLAVPSKKVAGDGKNSRRRSLRTAEEQQLWLENKAEQNGFSLRTLQIGNKVLQYGVRSTGKIQFDVVHFQGILQVTEPERFRKCWQTGIGPEKAYGMGMLLLAEG